MYYNSTAAAIKEVDTNSDEYQRGYMDAMRRKNERERERRRRKQYFIKQKAAGALLLAMTVVAVPAMDGDATIALITIPLGVLLLFSREMWINNEYYREVEERKYKKCQSR